MLFPSPAMLLDIIWNQETTQVDLAEGTVKIGGATSDDIIIAGLPHTLLRLTIEGEKVLVTATRSVQIGAALFPARVPRLLGEGEALQLPNDVVLRRVVDQQRRDSRKLVGTAFVAKELLAAQDVAPEHTRAACLTCVTGFDRGQSFAIAFERSIIGRGDEAEIRVRDRTVSRRHAQLIHVGKAYTLRALSNTNGLFVNGLRVKDERALKSGDIIELGQTMLRFDGAERAPEEVTAVKPGVEPPAQPKPPLEPEVFSVEAANAATEPLQPLEAKRISFEVVALSLGALMVIAGLAVTIFMLR